MPLVYPVKEVAEMLSVSDRTIWRMVKEGELQVVRIPGRRCTRIPASEVNRLLGRSTPRRSSSALSMDPKTRQILREMMAKMRP